MTGDTSPPPSLHITDIIVDQDKVRLAEDLTSSNPGTIVSVDLLGEHRPSHKVLQYLPQCPHLTTLCISKMSYEEDRDLLLNVIPRLTQLTTVWYLDGIGRPSDAAVDRADRAVVTAIMSLTRLLHIRLWLVDLGDTGVEGTDVMTRLRTINLHHVWMKSSEGWDRFLSSLLSLPQSVYVELSYTDIDEGTLRGMQTSPRVTITGDDRERDGDDEYERLEFRTVPSQTA